MIAPPSVPPADPQSTSAEPLIALPLRRPGVVRRAGGHFWHLARWKKVLLILAVLMAVAGVSGSVAGVVRGKPAEVKQAQAKVEDLNLTSRRSALTAEQTEQLQAAKEKVNAAKHWFYDQTAPQLWRIGLGFFVAFVLGFMARQFLKTVATLLAIVVVVAGVAIYFGWLDSGGVQSNLKTGTGWVMERLDSMKATLLRFAGASLSGTAGFVVGFTRSKKS